MARSSLDLAKHIIFLLKQKNYPLSNTKVQKVLYFYVGLCLATLDNITEKHDIIDELPNAFDNGPVFPRVFKAIKQETNINSLEKDYSRFLNDRENRVFAKTIELIGEYTAGKLSDWSHQRGSPWDIVYNQMSARYAKIPLELMKEYFEVDIVKNYNITL